MLKKYHKVFDEILGKRIRENIHTQSQTSKTDLLNLTEEQIIQML